ncbi:hypothetical protein OXPF_35500 [Oxobacter pfennigii]|uniref:Signal peptidase I n=1 Tax=Oxobacter pfennigii TaxID=36849 RepID=A0A0P8WKE8_9CLOT|nr:hypothetical protein [Oxobacter pfennigii]KPU42787.1 hypothetical protein OXPF_35500 [Oxobacter pfennigii]
MKEIKKALAILKSAVFILFLAISVILTASIVNSKNEFSTPRIGPIYLLSSEYAVDGNAGKIIVIHDTGTENSKENYIAAYTHSGGIAFKNVEGYKSNLILMEGDPGGFNIIGRRIMTIPYLGYLLNFASTQLGLAAIMFADLLIVLSFVSLPLMDIFKNSSKHKKAIIRKRKRRNERYMEEGRLRKRSAVV